MKLKEDEIVYSDKLKGDKRNYNWEAQYDLSGAYLGISQWHPDNPKGQQVERVLLSPEQVKGLVKFLGKYDAARAALAKREG